MKKNNNKSFWDKGAKLYDRAIKKDAVAYTEMYSLIRKALNPDMAVLELATGTGLIALNIANRAKYIEATDFSENMIEQANRKLKPDNVCFSVQDATNLPYAKQSFDAVIISNTLHIMPNPEKALSEIRRVLTGNGILIAPNFTHKGMSLSGKIKSKIMDLVGFQTFAIWSPAEYIEFLENNDLVVTYSQVLQSSFPLTYIQAKKVKVE
jgi:ubiquinone/menaquinone biosynthesis C-methylase UbiE